MENNITTTVSAEKEVIVSTGGINFAKLLLLSGIGPAAHLISFGIKVRSDLPVGENFQDHPVAIVAYKFKDAHGSRKPPNYTQFPFSVVMGFVALDKAQRQPTYQSISMAASNDSEGLTQLCSFGLGIDFDTCQTIYEASEGKEILITILNLLHPKSRGVIQLKSQDPSDPPLVFLGYYSDESDLDTIAESLADLDKIQNSTYFKSVGGELVDMKLPKCQGLLVGSHEYGKCHALSTRASMYHYSGACGMGRVVDQRLRVRGVQGLRIADSSALPYITSGNINAPVIMLAEKAADMIKEDNGY